AAAERVLCCVFFSSRRRHTRSKRDWSSDVCSSDLVRAYDLRSGEVLWRSRLPAGGQSTPASYLGRDGRQYLVVVAGGHGYVGTRLGDAVIAYALPEDQLR